MRTLEFTVESQRIRKKVDCDFSNLVAGSVGYLKAKFYFSEEWDKCKKAASFWVGDEEHPILLDSNDECVIPSEALTDSMFRVSVMGVRSDFKITSKKTKVRQEVQ